MRVEKDFSFGSRAYAEPEVVLASLGRAGFAADRTVVAGVFSEYIAIRRA